MPGEKPFSENKERAHGHSRECLAGQNWFFCKKLDWILIRQFSFILIQPEQLHTSLECGRQLISNSPLLFLLPAKEKTRRESTGSLTACPCTPVREPCEDGVLKKSPLPANQLTGGKEFSYRKSFLDWGPAVREWPSSPTSHLVGRRGDTLLRQEASWKEFPLWQDAPASPLLLWVSPEYCGQRQTTGLWWQGSWRLAAMAECRHLTSGCSRLTQTNER